MRPPPSEAQLQRHLRMGHGHEQAKKYRLASGPSPALGRRGGRSCPEFVLRNLVPVRSDRKIPSQLTVGGPLATASPSRRASGNHLTH